ncbi:monoglyceride lipase-like [Physella acuta]|uniref:monoglyceride lipase-like n=1 Tax=Physella acuta TaxID=109671 RepID=UPI0027DAEA30|nr:monoglyceride lipase-like [Physella acuta]XP_059140792.1 monoglyceride lipase-like [Physella acuta]XP_059140794.1 monoglyceride lipase-like [Physella acuta]XP_059140795.1 monoglyceride lipase-like [Physella acuta]
MSDKQLSADGPDASEKTFINQRGTKIFCKYWNRHLKSPKALVFICHGAGEHCLWYGQLAAMFTEKDMFVFAHDHEGHGQSGGPRMHITDFRHYSQDVYDHIDTIKKEFPNVPVFIIGHSMGGAVAILAALDHPEYFRGVVLIGPCVTPEQDTVGPVRIFLGKIASRIIPQCPVLWLDDADISRDKSICQKYKDDPLNYHGGMKAKWAYSLLLLLQEIEAKLKTITWPFFVLHGDSDKIVNSKGSEALFREASSKDKCLKIYPNCYHQLHYEIEPDGSAIRNDILDWIIQRLP